jgi:hypothetical protein
VASVSGCCQWRKGHTWRSRSLANHFFVLVDMQSTV